VEIECDPESEVVPPNEKVGFGVRFHQANLNTAAARELFTCEWQFKDNLVQLNRKGVFEGWKVKEAAETRELTELGWHVYHYFESNVQGTQVSVNFCDSEGRKVQLQTQGKNWPTLNITPKERERKKREHKDRWSRTWLELIQLGAALLVPLATLAATTATSGTIGNWWTLVGIGFGSDTIKNILVD
jgi:hypothetical protein